MKPVHLIFGATLSAALLAGPSMANASCKVGDACDFSEPWTCSSPEFATLVGSLITLGSYSYWLDQFSMACVRHDGCYRHGRATYGITRTQCDDAFAKDMLDRCAADRSIFERIYDGLRSTTVNCEEVAGIMYRIVQTAGDPHYHKSDTRVCYYDKPNENAHVSRIKSDGTFGSTECRYQWTSGWNVVSAFSSNQTRPSSDHLLFLKSLRGSLHIYRPSDQGGIGSRSDDLNWSDGWTIAKGFWLGNKPFIFFLKYSNGRAKINKVSPQGKILEEVYTKDFPSRYTIAEFYEVNDQLYLLLVKGTPLQIGIHPSLLGKGDGNARIYKLNLGGEVCRAGDDDCFARSMSLSTPTLTLVRSYNWTSGWSIARTYSIAGQTYLFMLKTSTGVAHINRMKNDGTVGARVGTYDWSSGWTTVEPYEVNGVPFMFFLKERTGLVHVNKLKPQDGTLGARVREYDWRSGWTSATFYRVEDELFALTAKSFSGGIDTNLPDVGFGSR